MIVYVNDDSKEAYESLSKHEKKQFTDTFVLDQVSVGMGQMDDNRHFVAVVSHKCYLKEEPVYTIDEFSFCNDEDDAYNKLIDLQQQYKE